MNRQLLLRAGLAATVAVLAITAVWFFGGETSESDPPDQERRTLAPAEPPDRSPDLPVGLKPEPAFFVYFVAAGRRVPPGVAPLLRLEPGGRLVLERGSPISGGPAEPDPGRLLAAGLQLPGESIGELTPVERAALLACWGAFRGSERRLSEPVALGIVDGHLLEELRRWVR